MKTQFEMSVLAAIDKYCARQKISRTAFGQRVTGVATFYTRLVEKPEGLTIKLHTLLGLVHFLGYKIKLVKGVEKDD